MMEILIFLLLLTTVFPKPRYTDLDEEDQKLFRAVFDTPSYDHEEQEDEEPDGGKMDLLKDGLWAIRAKLTELRAFNKALASNVLSTKLKLKELLTNHLPAKKHQHEILDKKKPSYYTYNYQPAAYYPQYPLQYPQYPEHPQHEPQQAGPQYIHDPYYGH